MKENVWKRDYESTRSKEESWPSIPRHSLNQQEYLVMKNWVDMLLLRLLCKTISENFLICAYKNKINNEMNNDDNKKIIDDVVYEYVLQNKSRKLRLDFDI